jgi:hypothetical protein
VPPVRRRRLVVLIAAGVVVFLAISFELARYLSAPNTERTAVYELLRDQARGDAPAMLRRLDGCAQDPACRALTERNARRLRRPGEPKILNFESRTAYTLGSKTGVGRVAWAIVEHNGFPVVQCVTVHHEWSFIHGASVSLRRLSAPIGNEASC